MEQTKNEIRFVPCSLAIREAEPQEDGKEAGRPHLCGRAIVFDSESVVLSEGGIRFRETIAPEACKPEWLATQDIKLNALHDRSQTFGRVGGNVTLDVKEDGVYFDCELPDCDIAERVRALVDAGVYTGCSFEFFPKDYEVSEAEQGIYKIRHTGFEALTALTVGMDPAYQATSVNMREAIEHAIEDKENREADEAAAKAAEEKRLKERQRLIAQHEREIEILRQMNY